MFNDLLDQPRRELETLRAQCAAQEARIAKLESMLVKCAADRPTSIAALKEFGCSLDDLTDNDFTQFRGTGFTVIELKESGYELEELIEAKFELYALKDAFTLEELKHYFDVIDLKHWFNAKDLKDAGFTSKEFKYGGFHAKDLKDAGFTEKEIEDARFNWKCPACDASNISARVACFKCNFNSNELKSAVFECVTCRKCNANNYRAKTDKSDKCYKCSESFAK